jgi:hypothetical protein
MNEEPKLSEAERALVIELLERERDELPVEIHHTRTAAYREELHRRAEMVHGLIDKLRAPAMV